MTPHRLDELRDGGHTGEAGVRPVDPAGEIRRSSVCSKRINAIQKDRRRTGKRNLRSVAAGGQEAMHHHGAFTTDLGKGGIDSRRSFNPVGALVNMKDLYAHTQLWFRTGPREPRLLRESPSAGIPSGRTRRALWQSRLSRKAELSEPDIAEPSELF